MIAAKAETCFLLFWGVGRIYVDHLNPSMKLIPLDFLGQVDEADELEQMVTKGPWGPRGEVAELAEMGTFLSRAKIA